MGGWVGGWMDGWMGRWVGGWVGGWMDMDGLIMYYIMYSLRPHC